MLEPYISSNTYLRTVAENDFEKKKLINFINQSERNEKDLHIIKNKKLRNASSIYFKEINFISQVLHLTEKDKRSREKSDKQIITGQTCSDKSKILLYAF